MKIKGGESVISEASEAVAIVKLTEDDTNDILKTWPIEIRNTSGEVLDIVVPERKKVAITIPIKQVAATKTVKVKVVTIGENLNQDYQIKRITTDPMFVEINGDLKIIEDVKYIDTSEIDVSSLNRDTTKTVDLVLPENLKISKTSPQMAIVLIEMEEKEETDESLR